MHYALLVSLFQGLHHFQKEIRMDQLAAKSHGGAVLVVRSAVARRSGRKAQKKKTARKLVMSLMDRVGDVINRETVSAVVSDHCLLRGGGLDNRQRTTKEQRACEGQRALTFRHRTSE
jgi:hypothetical protein